MVYKDHFVVVVKVGGRVMREQDGVVRLPFGSEFTLLLKNLNTTRAAASVQIDGTDVTNNYRLIVEANSNVELEGFMSADGAKVTNKFKFIEKTSQISEHRGDKADDGLVRVEYQFEKKPDTHSYHWEHHYPVLRKHYFHPLISPEPRWLDSITFGGSLPDAIATNTTDEDCKYYKGISSPLMSASLGDAAPGAASASPLRGVPESDNGITVKGSASGQTFKTGYLGVMEEAKHVIVLSLRGKIDDDRPVTKVVTVKDKISCEVCGTKSRSDCKFCSKCGAALASF